jgi:hypothetical protein
LERGLTQKSSRFIIFWGKHYHEQNEKSPADFARARGGNRRCGTVASGDGVADFLIGRDPLGYI